MRRRFQVAGVALVGVDVHLEDDLRVEADLDAVEGDAARAVDLEPLGNAAAARNYFARLERTLMVALPAIWARGC